MGSEVGRILDGQLLSCRLRVKRKRSPEHNGVRAGVTPDPNILGRSSCGREDAVLYLVVIGKRVDLDQRLVSGLRTGADIKEKDVVVHAQRRDGRTVIPLQV